MHQVSILESGASSSLALRIPPDTWRPLEDRFFGSGYDSASVSSPQVAGERSRLSSAGRRCWVAAPCLEVDVDVFLQPKQRAGQGSEFIKLSCCLMRRTGSTELDFLAIGGSCEVEVASC